MKQKEFYMIGLIAATVVIILLSVVAVSIENINASKHKTGDEQENLEQDQQAEDQDLEDEDEVPESVTGLLIGFDASRGLTDVLMVGHLDTETNEIKVISIPRDLVIDFREEEFKHIKENNPNNQVLYCKLTEVYSLTGWDEQALMDVREIASIITGLEIDYMASIDVYGFTELVDIVGGVEFDVPERMKYTDPVQDLYIDLQKGVQILDGDKAEQLVRYRKYTMGDLQRIQVQQDFMVALAEKVMKTKDIDQVTRIATSAYDIIMDSDFGLTSALEYVEYLFNLEMEEVLNPDNMMIVPSYGDKVGDIWFQRWDKEATREAIQELLEP